VTALNEAHRDLDRDRKSPAKPTGTDHARVTPQVATRRSKN
jgi:hypothetical protein